jgi:hypothetical protein
MRGEPREICRRRPKTISLNQITDDMRFHFTLLLLCYFTIAKAQTWQLLQTPAVHGFREFAVSHNGTTLYSVADRDEGVFRSTNAGSEWQHAWPGLRFYRANNAYYRVERDSVYRLMRSDNQLSSWTDDGILPVPTTQAVPHLTWAANGDVYCYIRDILFMRKAGQATWQTVFTQPNQTLRHLHINGDHIWLQADFSLLQSLDGGITFSPSPLPTSEPLMGMAGQNDTVVVMYRVSNQEVGVSRTIDGGMTWQEALVPSGLVQMQALAFPFYAIDYQGSWWRSETGLTGWIKIIDHVGSHTPRYILKHQQRYLITTDNGVLHQNSGNWRYAWHGFANPPNDNQVSHLSMAGDTLLCLSAGTQAAFSTNQGQTWQRTLAGKVPKSIFDVGTYFIGVDHLYLQRAAKDSDFDWRASAHPGPLGNPFAAMAQLGNSLYGTDGQIWRSDDGGATWLDSGGILQNSLMLGVQGSLISRTDSSLIASTDGGVNWQVRKTFPFPITSDVSRVLSIGDALFVSQRDLRKVMRSTDGGFTFTELTVPQDGGPFFQLRAHSNTLMLNTINPYPILTPGSIYVSTDMGQTWCDIGVPTDAFLINNAQASYMTDIAAHDGTVYLRAFNGQVWRKTCGGSIGTTTIEKAIPLVLIPNPGSAGFQIDLAEAEQLQVRVWSSIGQMMMQKSITANGFIHMNEQPNGLYFVEISNGQQLWHGKWVKE